MLTPSAMHSFAANLKAVFISSAKTRLITAAALILIAASLNPPTATAGEALVLEAGGSFEEVPGTESSPAQAFYEVSLPARGFFRGVVTASPALFGGPDGNNPNYHFSSQCRKVGEVFLGNFSTTDIEMAPIVTERSGLIGSGGVYDVQVLGPQKISFTFGDFIGGEAQNFTVQGYFDPSPIADAGPNIALETNTSGTLQGSGFDMDGDNLSYTWTRLFGPDLSLSDVNAAQPAIVAPDVLSATTTRMQLVVSDANSESVADTVDVVIYPAGGNIPPIVDAGDGTTGTFTTDNPLDGTGSYDLDGAVTLYSWTQTAGPRVDLSDPASPTPTFKQFEPAQNNVTYEFELQVSDGADLSTPDTVQYIINGYGRNAVPLGPRETLIYDDSGAVPEVTQISGDPPETVDYPGIAIPGPGRVRTEVFGTPALFNGPDGNNPAFHLSSHGSSWDGFGAYGFHQTDIEAAPVVTNTYFNFDAADNATLTIIGPQALSFTFLDFLYGEAQSFDFNVWFRPDGSPPVADAGTYPMARGGDVIQLDGTGSFDPDNDPLSYNWSQLSGPGGVLSNNKSPVSLFKVPFVEEITTLTLSLVVSDGEQSEPSTTTLMVEPGPIDSDLDGVLDEIEDAAPNDGDGNFDGTPDSDQNNVTSFENLDGKYLTLAVDFGLELKDVQAIANPSPEDLPEGIRFLLGFIQFEITELVPGAAATVELFVPDEITIDAYFIYGPEPDDETDHWYYFDFDGVTGAQFSGNVITLNFVDGARGDADLSANGIVVDPGAPGLVVGLTEIRDTNWMLYP